MSENMEQEQRYYDRATAELLVRIALNVGIYHASMTLRGLGHETQEQLVLAAIHTAAEEYRTSPNGEEGARKVASLAHTIVEGLDCPEFVEFVNRHMQFGN